MLKLITSVLRFFANIPLIVMAALAYAFDFVWSSLLDAIQFFLALGYELITGLLSSLGIIDSINSALSSMPPTALYFLNITGVIDAIVLILTASIVRFVITLIPGVGN